MPDDTKPVPPPELIPFLDAVAEMVADALPKDMAEAQGGENALTDASPQK